MRSVLSTALCSVWSALKLSLISRTFTEQTTIYFQNVSEDVVKSWINFFDEPLRGPFLESDEVHPISRNKIERDAIYNPKEKKLLKPNANCFKMYGSSNHEANKIAETLGDFRGRIMQECAVSADSFYEAILYQISHKKEKYKPYTCHTQFAYYLAKWPEVFEPIVRPHLESESYESFILNMFQGKSMPVLDVVCAILVKMWNLTVTVVLMLL